MFNQLVNRGARFAWCDEAIAREPVAPERMEAGWLLRRAFRGGNDHARHTLSGAYGPVRWWTAPVLAARASAQMVVAGALSVAVLPLGRHRHLQWLRKAWANAGKLAALRGARYYEYR
jgi:succinoglycan biosynthesis protein ExoM